MDNSMKDLNSKTVLTMDECVLYTGLSKSTMYKMTSNKVIPHYKPNNKLIYFKRSEVEAWLLSNPINTDEEITQKATDYCYSNNKA